MMNKEQQDRMYGNNKAYEIINKTLSDSEQQAMAQAAMQYHEEQKLERLRDEFAMHIKIDELTSSTAERIMGSERPKVDTVNMELIQWWLDAESKYRYMQADAMIRAREQSK